MAVHRQSKLKYYIYIYIYISHITEIGRCSTFVNLAKRYQRLLVVTAEFLGQDCTWCCIVARCVLHIVTNKVCE